MKRKTDKELVKGSSPFGKVVMRFLVACVVFSAVVVLSKCVLTGVIVAAIVFLMLIAASLSFWLVKRKESK